MEIWLIRGCFMRFQFFLVVINLPFMQWGLISWTGNPVLIAGECAVRVRCGLGGPPSLVIWDLNQNHVTLQELNDVEYYDIFWLCWISNEYTYNYNNIDIYLLYIYIYYFKSIKIQWCWVVFGSSCFDAKPKYFFQAHEHSYDQTRSEWSDPVIYSHFLTIANWFVTELTTCGLNYSHTDPSRFVVS
jgi:hypothetical protein